MTELVTDGLAAWAVQAPDRAAIVFDGHDEVSYSALARWTDAAAAAHRRDGLVAGDRLGILGENSLEWVVAAIGALKLGAVVVPLNSRFTPDELRYLIEDSGAVRVLSDAAHRDTVDAAAAGTAATTAGLDEFTALRAETDPAPCPRPDAGPDDISQIVYTSGTTSRPKGVVFTHRSTFNLIADFAMAEPALRPGARIQVIAGVPVLYEQMAARPEFAEADLSSIELATIAGAPARTPTIHAWLEKGVPLRQAYGMTELGGISSINPADQSLTRPESFGRGTVFTRHRVVRPDGTDCDAEEPGEIVVSGPGVTPGYWGNPAAYDEVMRDGWFHSGDVGIRDADGYLRIVDRMKDMIITGGYNVAPSEIESAVLGMDGVREVCVIGVDDPKFGEAPVAVVHADPGVDPDAVIEHCRTFLARYKVPRRVVLTDGPLERMASGKIARRRIRETHGDAAAASAEPATVPAS